MAIKGTTKSRPKFTAEIYAEIYAEFYRKFRHNFPKFRQTHHKLQACLRSRSLSTPVARRALACTHGRDAHAGFLKSPGAHVRCRRARHRGLIRACADIQRAGQRRQRERNASAARVVTLLRR